jgi:hypothetical protein
MEQMPWRLEWKCEACSQQVSVRLDKRLLPMVSRLDRPGGTAVSVRELRAFVKELADLETHAASELFYA